MEIITDTKDGSPKPSELTTAIAKLNLDEATAVALKDAFLPFENQANEWKEKAKALTVTDVSQVDKMAEARTARLALVKIRTGVVKLHKEKKANIIREGTTLDLIKNTLVGLVEPIEDELEKSEKFIEIETARVKAETRTSRLAQIKAINDPQAIGYDNMPLEEMPQDTFDMVLFGIKTRKEQRDKDEADLKLLRDQQEKDAEAERERIKKETEQLKAKQQITTERINRLSTMGLQWIDPAQYPSDMNLPTEKGYSVFVGTHWITVNDVDNATDEQFAHEISELAPVVKKYLEEKKKTEDENRAKVEKADLDKKQKAADERKAKRAPDKVKLEALAKQFLEFELPTMREDDTKEIIVNVRVLKNKIADYITKQCKNL